jgi:hypothetical protein
MEIIKTTYLPEGSSVRGSHHSKTATTLEGRKIKPSHHSAIASIFVGRFKIEVHTEFSHKISELNGRIGTGLPNILIPIPIFCPWLSFRPGLNTTSLCESHVGDTTFSIVYLLMSSRPPSSEGEGQVFEVEKILGQEERNGVMYFHVRWKGFGPDEDTLEPFENLENCTDLVIAYFDSIGESKAKSKKKSKRRLPARPEKLRPPRSRSPLRERKIDPSRAPSQGGTFTSDDFLYSFSEDGGETEEFPPPTSTRIPRRPQTSSPPPRKSFKRRVSAGQKFIEEREKVEEADEKIVQSTVKVGNANSEVKELPQKVAETDVPKSVWKAGKAASEPARRGPPRSAKASYSVLSRGRAGSASSSSFESSSSGDSDASSDTATETSSASGSLPSPSPSPSQPQPPPSKYLKRAEAPVKPVSKTGEKEEAIRSRVAEAIEEKSEARRIAEPRQKLTRVVNAAERPRTVRAQFRFGEVFHEHALYCPGPRDQWIKCVREQAELNMLLDNPFPIRRIIRFEKIKGEIGLVCELPDEVEPITLPMFQVNILHPEMVAQFLARSEEVLIGRD